LVSASVDEDQYGLDEVSRPVWAAADLAAGVAVDVHPYSGGGQGVENAMFVGGAHVVADSG
jgi:hypothetical protein